MSCSCGLDLRRPFHLALLAGAGLVITSAALVATSQPDAAQPEMTAEEKAWMEAGSPGEMHMRLEPMVGTFDAAMKFWMAPGEPPMEASGVAVNTWILDGRFLRCDFTSDMMGMQFVGIGFTGYDNAAKTFVGSWMDNVSTAILNHKGKAGDSPRVIEMKGEFTDPSGAVTKDRHHTRIISNDQHFFEMFHTGPDGAEVKVMEITYTRKDAGH